jgi:hypothetical protein
VHLDGHVGAGVGKDRGRGSQPGRGVSNSQSICAGS